MTHYSKCTNTLRSLTSSPGLSLVSGGLRAESGEDRGEEDVEWAGERTGEWPLEPVADVAADVADDDDAVANSDDEEEEDVNEEDAFFLKVAFLLMFVKGFKILSTWSSTSAIQSAISITSSTALYLHNLCSIYTHPCFIYNHATFSVTIIGRDHSFARQLLTIHN